MARQMPAGSQRAIHCIIKHNLIQVKNQATSSLTVFTGLADDPS